MNEMHLWFSSGTISINVYPMNSCYTWLELLHKLKGYATVKREYLLEMM